VSRTLSKGTRVLMDWYPLACQRKRLSQERLERKSKRISVKEKGNLEKKGKTGVKKEKKARNMKEIKEEGTESGKEKHKSTKPVG